MMQKGDSPLLYFMGARGIPVYGAWILISRWRKPALPFIIYFTFFSRKCFAESCRKRKFAGVKLQGGA